PPLLHPAAVNEVVWMPDGDRLGTACDDGVVRLWLRGGGRPQELVGHSGKVQFLAVSPDGRTMASAGIDHKVLLWDVTARTPVPRVCPTQVRIPRGLAFSPDGGSLIVGSEFHHAEVLAVENEEHRTDLKGNGSGLVAVRTIPGGSCVVT